MNPYAIILGLFLVAGFVVALWGVLIMAKARKTMRWPTVEGVIEESASASEDSNDLLPHILFSYTVAARTYQRALEFPGGTNPSLELATHYARKYPVGVRVTVHYNPDQPEKATLEPGLTRGDWMIPAAGIAAMAFGVYALFFSL